MKSIMWRWQVALGSSKKQGTAGQWFRAMGCVPVLPWLYSVTLDELAPISVSVSAVKVQKTFLRAS